MNRKPEDLTLDPDSWGGGSGGYECGPAIKPADKEGFSLLRSRGRYVSRSKKSPY